MSDIRYPWDDHVRRVSDLPAAAQREAIEFDRYLWDLAQEHPATAAHECVEHGIHYRTGEPRLGEPLFRSPLDAKHGWETASCGRGTGHFGTGLYFFGTLSAAVAAPRFLKTGLDEERLRAGLSDVWAVDTSAVAPEAVYRVGTQSMVNKLHDFAKALICYPDALRALNRAREPLAAVVERLAELRTEADRLLEGPADEPTPDAYYDLTDELDELRDQRRELVEQDWRALGDLQRYLRRIELDAPRMEIMDVGAVAPLGPFAQAAVDAYERDLSERRFPGYHPMTYYMRSLGYALIVHRSWDELNGGDIGNIWYPGTES